MIPKARVEEDPYRRTLRKLREMMREAVFETQKYDAKWKRINDELNAKLDHDGEFDIVQRNKVKAQSLALQDALGAGNWWRSKALYLANVIQAEISLNVELRKGGGGESDYC